MPIPSSPLESSAPSLPSIRLFDLNILAADLEQATDLLAASAKQRDGRARIVVTPNVDHIVRLDKQPEFKRDYACADFIFADGMPLIWFSRMMGTPLPERVTGADLFVQLCRKAVEQSLTVRLIGGMPGSEEQLRQLFEQHYPGLQIDFFCPSMRFDPLGEEGCRALQWVAQANADIVFVCLGLPKQERWALHHAGSLQGGVILCVGAAMAFAVGLQKRAPRVFQRLGMEWLWRLLSNPTHLWRRYLVEDPKFVRLCWQAWKQRKAKARATP